MKNIATTVRQSDAPRRFPSQIYEATQSAVVLPTGQKLYAKISNFSLIFRVFDKKKKKRNDEEREETIR